MSNREKRVGQSLDTLSKEHLFEELYKILLTEPDRTHAELASSVRRLTLPNGDVTERVERASAAIREKFGADGRFIGIDAPMAFDFLVLLWATLRSGNKPFLMDRFGDRAKQEAALSRLEAAGIVACGVKPRTARPLLYWETLPEDGGAERTDAAFGEEIAFLGADGESRVWNGEALAAAIDRVGYRLADGKKTPAKLLLALSLTDEAGLSLYWQSVADGTAVAFSDDPSAEAVMRTARSLRATCLAATPAVWHGADRCLCRLLDGKDEKVRSKFDRCVARGKVAPVSRELSEHLFGDTLRGGACFGGAVSDAARGRLCAVGYAVSDGAASDATESETVIERLLDLPLAEEWVAIAEAEGVYLVIRAREDLLSRQKQNLQHAVAACLGRLPAGVTVSEAWYTADPLSVSPAYGVDRAAIRERIRGGRLGRLDFSGADEADGEESEIKAILRTMFADILGVGEDEISEDGHFMIDLGGSSLDYFTLVGEINERFGINLGFEGDEFRYTLNDFERAVKDLVR